MPPRESDKSITHGLLVSLNCDSVDAAVKLVNNAYQTFKSQDGENTTDNQKLWDEFYRGPLAKLNNKTESSLLQIDRVKGIKTNDSVDKLRLQGIHTSPDGNSRYLVLADGRDRDDPSHRVFLVNSTGHFFSAKIRSNFTSDQDKFIIEGSGEKPSGTEVSQPGGHLAGSARLYESSNDVAAPQLGNGPSNTTDTYLADSNDKLICLHMSNGDKRYYEVHLPHGHESEQNLPAVLALDGLTHDKPYTGMAVDNGINAEADRDKFIAIYPMAKARTIPLGRYSVAIRDWNAPGVGSLQTDSHYNDEDYISAVIADVRSRYKPRDGFYSAGFSMGGEFQIALDHVLPQGTFVGNYLVSSTTFSTEGLPKSNIPVKVVRGDDDPVLPDNGGGALGLGSLFTSYLDIERTQNSNPQAIASEFLRANGGESKESDTGSTNYYAEKAYTARNNTKVIVDHVHNAGHYWFGSDSNSDSSQGGLDGPKPPNDAFNATKDMAQFFGLRAQD